MSHNPIALAIVSAVDEIRSTFVSIVEKIKENDAKSESVKASDLTEAISKSEDAAVVKIRTEMEKVSAQIQALQEKQRAARKSAQEILFPGTVAANTLDADERKALISQAAELRKQIAETYKSAILIDPTVAELDAVKNLPPVVGQRGRQAGFVSGSKGKPKPRVSAISLDGNALEKATFGNLQKKIKETTGVAVENDVIVTHFLKALGTDDWQSDSVKGKTVEFTLDVKDDRSVSVSVTV